MTPSSPPPAQTWELQTRARTGAKRQLVRTARTPTAKRFNEVGSIAIIVVSFQGDLHVEDNAALTQDTQIHV